MTTPDTSRTTDEYSVRVSGGSMGGLFTGIAVLAARHDVRVYERSSGELRHRGAGIVAQPQVTQFLADYGVADPEELTTATRRRRYLAPDGSARREYRESMRFTSWDAVYRRLRASFPGDRYEAGREVVDDEQLRDGVAVRLADGEEDACDLFVAAEGWRSATRERHLPDATPEYAGYVAWRGVVDERALPDDLVAAFDGTFAFFDGDGQLVLAYLIPGADGGVGPGERRLNWVWYDRVAEDDLDAVLTDEDGRRRDGSVPPGALRDDLEDRLRARAESHPPQFERLVRATADPFVQPIVDLAVPRTTFGRTCLLGDAAFAARPHTAAGTAKAARDGRALAEALEERHDLHGALDEWASAQREYGRELVERGRRMGLERLD